MTMLTKLKKIWQNSAKTSSTKPGKGFPLSYKLNMWKLRTARYLSTKKQSFILTKADLMERYQINHKIKLLLQTIFDISITGLAISYCLNHSNWISYGLTAALCVYYYEFIVDKIKEKQ